VVVYEHEWANAVAVRYVDLTEAIDTNDASFMDNADFQEADAVPLNGPLPESHYLEDEVRRTAPDFVFDYLLLYCVCFRTCAKMFAPGFSRW
jgi:hypothetical protein